jgi:alpha-tubulin suppressor-like RCC1 family protein
VFTGYSSAYATDADGTLHGWGSTGWFLDRTLRFGLLGLGSEEADGVGAVRSPTPLPLPVPIRSVAGGKWHSIALGVDGSLFTAGDNSFGQLGIDSDQATSADWVEVAPLCE